MSVCFCAEDLCNSADGCSDKTNISTTSSHHLQILGSSPSDAGRNNFTTPDFIRTETSTPKGDCINEQTCSNERVQHHEDSLRSQFMHYATVSLVVLATFMCIIYVGTKTTVRQRLSTNNRDYDMT